VTAAVAGAGAAAIAAGGPPAGGGHPVVAHQAPPPLPACLVASPVPCYGQDPLHRVYHLGHLYARGITGAGTTIAVIVPGGNPWLRADLAAYSRYMRLPPARVKVVSWGQVPAARPDAASAYWAQEGTADAELAHFAAPAAGLVYLEVPPQVPFPGSERAATAALGWLATHQRIDVASFSWGTDEAELAAHGGAAQIPALRAGLVTAARTGITIIAGSGDSGPTGPSAAGGYDPRPTVAWPTSDPLVTGAGALTLHLNAAGRRLAPATVTGGTHATGAGLSAFYHRPAYQHRAAGVVGSHRGVVDVAVDGCAWVYLTIAHLPHGPTWQAACGTSFSAPLFAGITALAAQQAGHPLGPLNPLLYRLHGHRGGITDVTHGDNSDHGVTGYQARRGYDLPSGIGTIGSAPAFVTALARLAAHR
jgi:subtilase family serine protease